MRDTSPELDTLDQLQGGDMPLSVVRRIYLDDVGFARSIHALLRGGDIRLFKKPAEAIPSWQWRELFEEGKWRDASSDLWVDLTELGARRVT